MIFTSLMGNYSTWREKFSVILMLFISCMLEVCGSSYAIVEYPLRP
jgi:hypothetical protein